MTNKRILNETESHYTSGPRGRKGNDHFEIKIPTDHEYEEEKLEILEDTMGSGARIDDSPDSGQTGTGLIKVHWWYNAFGKIRYNVKAWAREIPDDTAPELETLIVLSDTNSHTADQTWYVLGDLGDDSVSVELPDGFSFKEAELEVVVEHFRGGANITDKPDVGSRGKLSFKVHWWYDAIGCVRYRLKVTANRTSSVLAAQIRDNGQIQLATAHSSGRADDANARQNIVDTANGFQAARSSYGNAPGEWVELDYRMLDGLLALAETYSFSVSELAGGNHSRGSRHFVGVAADINYINGVRVVTANHSDLRAFRQAARNLGADQVLDPANDPVNHDDHIHLAWPRP